jgi:hypothetical protein
VIEGLGHCAIFNRTIANHTMAPLFHFFVRRVLAATVAELLELQPFGRRLPIFGRRVVPLFAVTTL